MHHELHTEIEIDAPAQTVWTVLTDLDHYSDWNPFIVEASGEVEVDQRLINRLQPPGGRAMTIKPAVTVVETAKTFEWLGHLGFSGIFDGRHRFDLEATPSGGTRLVQSEQFNGVLVRFMRKMLDKQTRDGFVAMNSALKARAEETMKGSGVVGGAEA